MPAITLEGEALVVTLEPNETRWGLLSDLRVPVSSVSAVDVVADGRKAAQGIRAPGLGGSQRLTRRPRTPAVRLHVHRHFMLRSARRNPVPVP